MSDRQTPDVEISSFAAPTAEDIAQLERLSDVERRAVIAREIRRGIDSGVSELTMEDVWSEAMRRVRAKAPGTDAL